MARSRRRPELQREGQVRCRFCGGFYDPSLPQCPNCGYQTEENQSYVTDWRTIGPDECAGGFGGPRSPIQIAAKWLGGLLVGLLIVVAVVGIGKGLSAATPPQPAAASSSAPAEPNPSASAGDSSAPAKAPQTKPEDKQTPPEALSMNYTDLTLQVQEKLALELTVTPSDWKGTVKWSTSDQYVAWVDQEGTITCMGGGECTITASAGKVKAQCRVLCNGAASDHNAVDTWVKEQTGSQADPDDGDSKSESDTPLTLNLSDMTLMRPGDAYILVADGGGGHYTWTSANSYVATVDDGGVVTAVSRGDTTVTCTGENGDSVTCRVHVTYG